MECFYNTCLIIHFRIYFQLFVAELIFCRCLWL